MNKIYLAFGIAILFIALSIIPSTATNLSISKTPQILSDGNILYVGGSGEKNYTKIQDAIDDASDGDTVFVYDDSSPYYEWDIQVNKSINLIGQDKNTTIINGNQNGDVLNITADNVKISGFLIQNNNSRFDIAIKILSDSNCIINNIIIENWYGIIFDNSDNNIIKGNKINSNYHKGISFLYSCNNSIIDNIITNNGKESDTWGSGISFSDSNNNTIIGNNINLNNHNSLELRDSKFNIIKNNNVKENKLGIYLYHYCSNNIVYNNNLTNNFYNGISLGTCNNNIINDNIISNNYCGISIESVEYDSYNNTICNNTIYSNSGEGIGISNSYDDNIIKNSIYNNKNGIELNLGTIESNINSNIIFSNKNIGIYMYGASIRPCKYNNITENKIYLNENDGIYNNFSHNTTITRNIISNNKNGINFLRSCGNKIINNNISSNNLTGIYIENNCYENTIYHNNLVNNTLNAYDDGQRSNWDDGTYGNYWDDYKERYPKAHKKPLKGIWDTPYEIPPEGSDMHFTDDFPLINQWPKSKDITNNRLISSSLLLRVLERYPFMQYIMQRFGL